MQLTYDEELDLLAATFKGKAAVDQFHIQRMFNQHSIRSSIDNAVANALRADTQRVRDYLKERLKDND